MAFYGAIEQLLTGWIFGLLPQGGSIFERAKWLVVETSAAASKRARWSGRAAAERVPPAAPRAGANRANSVNHLGNRLAR